jgi:hypothetical protein
MKRRRRGQDGAEEGKRDPIEVERNRERNRGVMQNEERKRELTAGRGKDKEYINMKRESLSKEKEREILI